ncbi:hypothetical protein Patl1_32145 [Pistacia atlantica]|uniref:Uncharacterized protein n=1 Tax=Pistacia atlantica TaxID=434234 RepID=A0ACC1AQL1_9ROSI|nr:hypothetical protein Patl1_32145 [Pistacia atlantica]
MSPGHQIPMIDMTRLLAAHGVKATIITTPLNKSRFHSIINRDVIDQQLPISLLTSDFPFAAANLPPNCQNLDALPSRDLSYKLSKAIMMMQPQADDLIR